MPRPDRRPGLAFSRPRAPRVAAKCVRTTQPLPNKWSMRSRRPVAAIPRAGGPMDGSGRYQDLAELFVRLQIAVRLDDLLEGEGPVDHPLEGTVFDQEDRKSTRLNSSH